MREFIDKYDFLQDRDMDETGSNGVWDLSKELVEDIYSVNIYEGAELLYNILQIFKEAVLERNREGLKIETNNGTAIKLLHNVDKDCVVKETLDSKGNIEKRESIELGDIITMLNWYSYQKNIGNKDLMF